MNSRERIRKFLSHEPVDRIPCGLGGCETTGLHVLAYERLKNILGVQDPNNKVCTFMTNAVFEPRVLEALEADIVLLGTRMCPARFWGPGVAEQWKDLEIWETTLQVAGEWDFRRDPDGTWWWGERRQCPPGGLYLDTHPSMSRRNEDAAVPSPADYNPPHELPAAYLDSLRQSAEWLHENTDLSICCGESITSLQVQHGGHEAW